MTCGGSVSWFGFAQAIFARAAELLAVKPPALTPIATKDYPTPAARPRNSVLSNAKLHARFADRAKRPGNPPSKKPSRPSATPADCRRASFQLTPDH